LKINGGGRKIPSISVPRLRGYEDPETVADIIEASPQERSNLPTQLNAAEHEVSMRHLLAGWEQSHAMLPHTTKASGFVDETMIESQTQTLQPDLAVFNS
jgi:hypothetical protein